MATPIYLSTANQLHVHSLCHTCIGHYESSHVTLMMLGVRLIMRRQATTVMRDESILLDELCLRFHWLVKHACACLTASCWCMKIFVASIMSCQLLRTSSLWRRMQIYACCCCLEGLTGFPSGARALSSKAQRNTSNPSGTIGHGTRSISVRWPQRKSISVQRAIERCFLRSNGDRRRLVDIC